MSPEQAGGGRLTKKNRFNLCLFLSLVLLAGCIRGDRLQQSPRPVPAASSAASSAGTTPAPDDEGSAVRSLLSIYDCVPDPQNGEWARVIEVIDGDTISVLQNGLTYRVRLVGINAPEMDEQAGPDALACSQRLLAGQDVYLLKDVSETDQYNRLLRYVFTSDTFVNYSLVREGCAFQVAYPPDTACTALLEEAENAAKADSVGFWANQAEEGALDIRIREVFYNGVRGENEPDEYVEIENMGAEAVDLSGWYLRDQGSHRFTFPSFQMAPGQVCRVYTDESHPETCGFSFGVSDSGIWNNGGDCAFLFASNGNLVGEFCY